MSPDDSVEKDFAHWLENDPIAKKIIAGIAQRALDKNYFIPLYGKTQAELKPAVTGNGVNPPVGKIVLIKA